MIAAMVSASAYFVWYVSTKGDGELFDRDSWSGADQYAFGSITILAVGLLGMLYVATMVKSRRWCCSCKFVRKIFSKELPRIYVERMSLEKNRVFQQKYPQSIILTADTVVSVGRRILPKTMDVNLAEECLKLISGRRHKVFTSFTIYTPNNSPKTKTVQSIV